MNKEQEAKFDKWIGREIIFSTHPHDVAHEGWQACLEANGIGEEPRIPDGYFKIGEEVEIFKDDIWQKGYVVASDLEGGTLLHSSGDVRRIPAWKPKAHDLVFVLGEQQKAVVGKFLYNEPHSLPKGYDYWIKLDTGFIGNWRPEHVKMFNADMVGESWELIK